jgi:hypothetical protein
VYKKNTLNLMLFIDGASFSKSSSSSTWAIFCTVCELPPLLRSSFQNIMRLMFWNGRAPNFQAVFDHFLIDFKEVLNNGITIKELNLHLNINVHCFIADSQARPKVINSIQYNGVNGCLHCLNPGVSLRQGKRIYSYDPNVEIRDHFIYNQQVQIANESNQVSEGIKGSSCLDEYMMIPENVILDYMHLSLEGFVKQIISIWLDTSNHRHEYYLGNYTLK